MPDIDLRGILIAGALLGCAVGGIVFGIVVLAWPSVWAWLKPLLHAATA